MRTGHQLTQPVVCFFCSLIYDSAELSTAGRRPKYVPRSAKYKVCWCVGGVCVDLSCQAFVIHWLPGALWLAVGQSQTPGGKGIQLQGWKLISNQANQCQNVDRLMGAVMDLMSFCLFCHSIVIYSVRPFHLIAILQ